MRRIFSLFWALILCAFLGLSGFFALNSSAVFAKDLPSPTDWASFQDPYYGATMYYPSNYFNPGTLKADTYVFSSRFDDGAKLYLKVIFDPLRTGAEATVTKLKSSTNSDRITNIQFGDMWYQMRLKPAPTMQQVTRVIYTCKERIVSTITLVYPVTQAKTYEKMLDKLKRRFSIGIGMKTPVRECS